MLSPMERPNLGKSRVLVEHDNLLYTKAALAPRISYPLVTSAVTIPRQVLERRKFHCYVTMRVLSKLHIILFNILERSILISVIIFFEIMFNVKILLLATYEPKINWLIFSRNLWMRKGYVR